jgi:hypothetical protein
MALNPFWKGSLLMLAALLVGAAAESLAVGESAQPIRLWLFYLTAHSFCYAFILTSTDELSAWERVSRVASFAGAMMIGVIAINVAIGLAFAKSKAMEFVAVWPLTLVAVIGMAIVDSIGVGLWYGLCIVVGQRIWFAHRAPTLWPVAIWHALWGMVASLVAVSAIAWAQLALTFAPGWATGSYLSVAGIMWLVSMPHLFLAWRAAHAAGALERSTEPPRPIFLVGLAAALTLPLLFVWSLSLGQLAPALGGSIEEVRIGGQSYHVPSSLIARRHLDNLRPLDRRWLLLRMELGGDNDQSQLEGISFNVYVEEEPVQDWQNPIERLNCARNLFGRMSGCWTHDAMDWEGAYPFAKPTPDSVFEFHPPHVVSRIDIVVLDDRRQYQALLDGLTGYLYLDDGRATWRFHVPDSMLKDLDKIVAAARSFQERLKRESPTSGSPS